MSAAGTLSIAHVDAESGFSGGEVQVFLLMEGLRARGHRNVLFAPPGSRSVGEAARRGFEARAVRMRGDLDLPAVLRLRRELQQAHVELVHLHTGRATWLGGLAARWLGLSAITTRRQDRALTRSGRTRFVYEKLVRRAVAISPAVARRLAEGGVEPARVVTIPSAVDVAQLRARKTRAQVRAGLGFGADDFVVLTLAALVTRKGVDVLLEACARVGRACTLLVAGEGPERARLEAHRRDRDCAILLASHNMREVERLCDRVLMLKQGDLVDDASPNELLARYGRETLEEVFLDVARGRANGADE